MAFIPSCLIIALLNLAAPSLQQSKDPLRDFCRRWGHQTAVIDKRLYIDGGQVTWNPESQNPLNYTNTWLLYSDLNSTTVDGGMPLQYANLTKNSTVPSLSGGALWPDNVNKVLYQYGGEFQNDPEAFSFWAYDVLLNQWNESNAQTNNVQRVSWGGSATIDELGLGFYYGGYSSNQTMPGWSGPPLATSNLIRYDMIGNVFTNNTGPDSVGRAEGVMQYLPASDGGLLVYFGGIEDASRNGTVAGANMSDIHVFDVSSSKWYTQTATGNIPPSRKRFSAGATWADDHSSYNIYLYGGEGITNVTGFDDAYILSLPSFQWIKVWPSDSSNGTNPHGMSTCNVIDNAQMIIIGGWFSFDQTCDSANVWGQHNMNLGINGPQNALWDKYYPNITSYFVPTPVISSIGGGPTGGATATKPLQDWSNPDLSVYFTRVPTFAARSATRPVTTATSSPSGSSSHHSHAGAIAGGVVGGLVGLIAILGLLLFCLRRVKKSRKTKADEPKPVPPTELPAETPVHELGTPAVPKWQTSPSQQYSTHSRSPSGNAVSPEYGHPNAYYSTSPQPQQQLYDPHYPQGYNQESYPSPSTYPSAAYAADNYPTPTSAHHEQQHYPTAGSPTQQQYGFAHHQSPQNPPYNPAQHPINQQYFPPPPDRGEVVDPRTDSHSGTSSQSNTPAHFYPQPLNVPRQVSGGGELFGNEGRRSRTPDRRPIRGRFVEEEDY